MRTAKQRRQWGPARDKVEAEGYRCRVCGSGFRVQAAHVIPRSLAPGVNRNQDAVNIVPLCEAHHRAYDHHQLDLLPYLNLSEQLAAVEMAGGIGLAYRRVCNLRELP